MPLHELPYQISVRSAAAEEVAQSVAARTADLGVTSLPSNNPALALHWLAEAPCVAVLLADDPLARREILTMGDLAGRRLICTATPYPARRRIDEALRAARAMPATVIDTNTSITAIGSVSAGLGGAIIEPVTPANPLFAGVVQRPAALADTATSVARDQSDIARVHPRAPDIESDGPGRRSCAAVRRRFPLCRELMGTFEPSDAILTT